MDDSKFYEIVAAELAENDVKPGVWAKALAEALGNTDVAKGLYIRFRVEQLVREAQEAENATKAQSRADAQSQRHKVYLWAFLLILGVVVISTFLGDLSNGNRSDIRPGVARAPQQSTQPSNSKASLEETIGWISQNFRYVGLGGVDTERSMVLDQLWLKARGCVVEMRTGRLPYGGRGRGVTTTSITIDLGSLYFPGVQHVYNEVDSSVSALKFQTKGGQPIVQVTTSRWDGRVERSPTPWDEFKTNGEVRSPPDWTEKSAAESVTLYFNRAMATRQQEAFTRAIQLCGGGGTLP